MDRPILFSGPMVRALLTGSKTQTRRIAEETTLPHLKRDGDFIVRTGSGLSTRTHRFRRKYCVGDRLYVREEFSGHYGYQLAEVPPRDWSPNDPIWFWADGSPDHGDWTRPKPGMHMPRWASRLTLTVTDVRVQRLREIDRDDAIAEGLIRMPSASPLAIEMGCDWGFDGDARCGSPVSAYAALWNSLNAERALGWDVNPWVVAVTFTVEQRNIDEVA